MLRPIIHTALHFLLPAAVARLAFKPRWKMAWGVMVLTMVIDLDHLAANPVYDPNRCSIGFHPFHSYPAIMLYALMIAIPGLRIPSAGLLLHIGIDLTDCVWMVWAG